MIEIKNKCIRTCIIILFCGMMVISCNPPSKLIIFLRNLTNESVEVTANCWRIEKQFDYIYYKNQILEYEEDNIDDLFEKILYKEEQFDKLPIEMNLEKKMYIFKMPPFSTVVLNPIQFKVGIECVHVKKRGNKICYYFFVSDKDKCCDKECDSYMKFDKVKEIISKKVYLYETKRFGITAKFIEIKPYN